MNKKDEIVVSDFQEIFGVITKARNNGNCKFDITAASDEDKKRIVQFAEGAIYALNAEFSIEKDICEIKVKQDMIYNFIECYYGKNQEDIEKVLYPETNIKKIINKFKNGQKLTLNFSELPEETAKEYFNKISGAIYSLHGNISKYSETIEDIYVFIPTIKVTGGMLSAIIKDNILNIRNLTEDESDGSKIQDIKRIFEKNISLYDSNFLLTDDRLRYSKFLEKKSFVEEAIKQVEQICSLHINYAMHTYGLFKRALIKCMELKCYQDGVEAAESFANTLIEQCEACSDSSYRENVVGIICNEKLSLLIQNKMSRRALKTARKIKKKNIDLEKGNDFSSSQFNFLTAKALLNLGHFTRSLLLVNSKLNDKENSYYVEGMRLKAAIYTKRGCRSKAIDTFEALLKIYDSNPDKYSIVYSLDCGSLGNHYLGLKRDKIGAYNRAIELYKMAIEHCTNKNERADHLHNLGAAYKKKYSIQGQAELLKRAKAAFIKAMNLYMESTNPYIDNCEDMLITLEFLDEIIKVERKIESKLRTFKDIS